jgi:endonuclease/exonuclease/phosphatase family metal-dependent hydrolase
MTPSARRCLLALSLATGSLAQPSTITVATYNIRSGAGTWNPRVGPWELPHVPWRRTEHLDRIHRTLEEAEVDLVGLQEVQGKNLRSGLIDQPRYLGGALGFEHRTAALSRRLGGIVDRTSIAALSRWEILEHESVRLDGPGQDSTERAAQFVRLDHPAFPDGLWLGNTHMQGGFANPVQMRRIRNWLAEHPGPVILLGDFNVSPEAAGVRDLLAWEDGPHRFRDAVAEGGAGGTPTTSEGTRQIDHVLYSGPFRVRSARVHTEAGGESDHFPVIVEFEVLRGGPGDGPFLPGDGPFLPGGLADLFGLGAVR